MIVTATWMKGKQVVWYEWVFVEEIGAYINRDNGQLNSPRDLLLLARAKHDEGWMLCRRVV